MKNRKNRGFTLIEILVSVAIGAIFLGLVTQKFIMNSAETNSMYKNKMDVRTGVKSSMEMVINTLKDADQIYLVDKSIYDPKTSQYGITSNTLDDRYNYIAVHDDGKNRQLVNIVSRGKGKGFDFLPIAASDDDDMFKNGKIYYNFILYKDRKDLKKKFDDKVLDITIEGKSDFRGKEEEFALTRNIVLKNVNKIMYSEYFKGDSSNPDNVTAIAYRTEKFAKMVDSGNTAVNVGVTLAVSDSMYMNKPFETNADFKWINSSSIKPPDWVVFNLAPGYYKAKPENKEYTLSDYATGRPRMSPKLPVIIDSEIIESESEGKVYINQGSAEKYTLDKMKKEAMTKKGLAGPPVEKFINSLGEQSIKLDIDTILYMFNYNTVPQNEKFDISNESLYDNILEEYTAYNLKDKGICSTAKSDVKAKLGLDMSEASIKKDSESTINGFSNVGEALLQEFEILNQLKKGREIEINNTKKFIKTEKNYLVIIIDGYPAGFTYAEGDQRNLVSSAKTYQESYKGKKIERAGQNEEATNMGMSSEDLKINALKYVKEVIEQNMKKGTVDKVFVISFDKAPYEIPFEGTMKKLGLGSEYKKMRYERIDQLRKEGLSRHKAKIEADKQINRTSVFMKYFLEPKMKEIKENEYKEGDVICVDAGSADKLSEALQNVQVDIEKDITSFEGPRPYDKLNK